MPTSPLPGTAQHFIYHLMANPSLLVAMLCFAGYLLGSIPFGLILSQLFGYGDIRAIGSGNIGATNVLRTGNKSLALFTLLLDAGKGAVAVLFARYLDPAHMLPVWVGLAAIAGHCFPLWLGFKGGKGVATAFGVILALDWMLGGVLLAVWLIMAFVFRYSSLAAITAFIAAPLIAWMMDKTSLALPLAALAVFIIYNHHENIRRILKGDESKIGQKKA